MSFIELDKSAAASIFSNLGERGTFTPGSTRVPRPVTMVVDTGVRVHPDGFDSQSVEIQTQVSFLCDEVGDPARGDQVIIDGDTYTVDGIVENDGTVAVVSVI